MGRNVTFESLMERWNTLKSKVVERKNQFEAFEEYIKENTDYFNAPASPKYHLNCEHGLLEHSLNVAEHMIKIKNVLCPEISDESCVWVGLFHDLGKAGDVGQPYYKIKEATPKQKQYGYSAYPPYEYNENLKPYFPVPTRSIVHLLPRVNLTREETQAILIHDGQYVTDNNSYATKECKLALIAHYADSWSGFAVEEVVIKFGENKNA